MSDPETNGEFRLSMVNPSTDQLLALRSLVTAFNWKLEPVAKEIDAASSVVADDVVATTDSLLVYKGDGRAFELIPDSSEVATEEDNIGQLRAEIEQIIEPYQYMFGRLLEAGEDMNPQYLSKAQKRGKEPVWVKREIQHSATVGDRMVNYHLHLEGDRTGERYVLNHTRFKILSQTSGVNTELQFDYEAGSPKTIVIVFGSDYESVILNLVDRSTHDFLVSQLGQVGDGSIAIGVSEPFVKVINWNKPDQDQQSYRRDSNVERSYYYVAVKNELHHAVGQGIDLWEELQRQRGLRCPEAMSTENYKSLLTGILNLIPTKNILG